MRTKTVISQELRYNEGPEKKLYELLVSLVCVFVHRSNPDILVQLVDGLHAAKVVDQLLAEYEAVGDVTDDMLARIEELSNVGINFLDKVVDKNLVDNSLAEDESDIGKKSSKQKHSTKVQLLGSMWFRMCVLHPTVLVYSFMQLGFLGAYLDAENQKIC